jgi:hypothetical protein
MKFDTGKFYEELSKYFSVYLDLLMLMTSVRTTIHNYPPNTGEILENKFE